MIVGFSKLFSDIIHSTVWREEMHVKVVWVTMLAMADRHGQVMASVPGLADAAKVTLDQCLDALQKFQSPDEYSRTKDYDGRRIMEIDGGWLLFNYEKFRDRKDDEEQRIKTRERVRKFREKAKGVTENVTVTPGNDIQKQIQKADTDIKKKNEAAKFGYPIQDLLSAFPDLELTPGQCGQIVAAVTTQDKEAWKATIEKYQANHNPALKEYMPHKVGNLLGVFQDEKRKLEKRHGKDSKRNSDREGQTTDEYLASIGANPRV